MEEISLASGQATALVSDPSGPQAAVTATGVKGTATYGTYGTPTATGEQIAFGFQGAYQGTGSYQLQGLLYMINRYYDPSVGQFISVDPLVSQTEQPYAFAGGNPVNRSDPTGLEVAGVCVWGAIGAGLSASMMFCHLSDSGGHGLWTYTPGVGGGVEFGAAIGWVLSTTANNVRQMLGGYICAAGGGLFASVSVCAGKDSSNKTQVELIAGGSIGLPFSGSVQYAYTYVDPWLLSDAVSWFTPLGAIKPPNVAHGSFGTGAGATAESSAVPASSNVWTPPNAASNLLNYVAQYAQVSSSEGLNFTLGNECVGGGFLINNFTPYGNFSGCLS